MGTQSQAAKGSGDKKENCKCCCVANLKLNGAHSGFQKALYNKELQKWKDDNMPKQEGKKKKL